MGLSCGALGLTRDIGYMILACSHMLVLASREQSLICQGTQAHEEAGGATDLSLVLCPLAPEACFVAWDSILNVDRGN